MVAGEHRHRNRDAVEYGLDVGKFGVRALVGEVAVHHHVVEASAVDFLYGLAQPTVVFISGRHMHVTQHGDALAPGAQGDCRCCQRQKKSFHGIWND